MQDYNSFALCINGLSFVYFITFHNVSVIHYAAGLVNYNVVVVDVTELPHKMSMVSFHELNLGNHKVTFDHKFKSFCDEVETDYLYL